ncbi:hypothetical protein CPB84DRAFT_1684105 [Gymnopilus junonius]|uniref:Uncharacterized protein n=1 Tax=Gymnopilus junonius TaxID=109634 RepID=A0A9P5TJL4_GYMJU|nr:hypothetical protein CPB84DRAFT_1684105 [Gymnopilus junonius]
MVVRDIRTRWNYTQAMIERALQLRQAINKWVMDTGEMDEILLTQGDWTLLEQLNDILKVCDIFLVFLSQLINIFHQVFTEVTLQMSHASTPTISFVLPLYRLMENHLLKVSQDSGPDGLPRNVRAAANRALDKLYKYKSQADDHHYYKLGTSKFKLFFFY